MEHEPQRDMPADPQTNREDDPLTNEWRHARSCHVHARRIAVEKSGAYTEVLADSISVAVMRLDR
jgi:hypothetical protein